MNTETWLGQRCIALATQAVATPSQPYTDGSYFVTQYANAAPVAYKLGGDARVASFNQCIIGKATVRGMPASDVDALGMRLFELGERYKAGTPMTISRPTAVTKSSTYRGSLPPIVPLPPVIPPKGVKRPTTDPAESCSKGGGIWDPVSKVCGPAVTPDTRTPEQVCFDSGGTWDLATTSCIPAGGTLMVDDGTVPYAGALNYPRVHREALGYGYWALDIPPEADATAMAALDLLAVRVTTGPVEGLAWVALQAPDPGAGSALVNAGEWVRSQRAAGLAVIGTLFGTDAIMVGTNEIAVASQVTGQSDQAAVMFEPSGGWIGPGAAGKTALYIGLGVAGVAVLAGGAYYLSRKPKRIANPRRGRRRRNR
jgi:hypothetical protein